MKTVKLSIEGMSCGHCVMAVRRELTKIKGVDVQDVQVGSAAVQYQEGDVSFEQLHQAVSDAGYRVASIQ